MLADFWARCRTVHRFRDYKPQPVTHTSFKKWFRQFDEQDRSALRVLLNKIVYLTEQEVESALVELNDALLNRLGALGIASEKTIYVQIHEAGSSSPVMLNKIRDRSLLEKRHCVFLDSHDVLTLHKKTNELEEGAIVYVDDFTGTGRQFCTTRDHMKDSIVGSFAEFLLVPVVCEEALYELGKRDIEAYAKYIHSKAERPLHENSTILDPSTKGRLRSLCKEINPRGGLGFKQSATMVILYNNSPNLVPSILRGSINQRPWKGLVPRTTDLPTSP
jgi:hypothetical protein